MRFILALVLALASPLFAAVVSVPMEVVAQKVAGAKARNVVFILAADHCHDAMSFMGESYLCE